MSRPARSAILVVGSVNTDFVVAVPRLPEPGETIVGTELTVAVGGKGANQAAATATLGMSTHLVATVGRDAFADAAIDALASVGVDVSHIRRSSAHTGLAMIAVDPGGANSIVVAPNANGELSPSDVDRAMEALPDIAVVLCCLEVPEPAVLRAAAIANERHAIFVLNPAPARPVPAQLLAVADVLTPNSREVAAMGGVAAVARCGARTIVGTLGSKGAWAVSEGRAFMHPTYDVECVDSTGAGDAFSAALAVALADQMPLRDAVSFACAAGALATRGFGARSSLPRRSEVCGLVQGGHVTGPLPPWTEVDEETLELVVRGASWDAFRHWRRRSDHRATPRPDHLR